LLGGIDDMPIADEEWPPAMAEPPGEGKDR
jgi:hypothetical protein